MAAGTTEAQAYAAQMAAKATRVVKPKEYEDDDTEEEEEDEDEAEDDAYPAAGRGPGGRRKLRPATAPAGTPLARARRMSRSTPVRMLCCEP